MTGYLTLVDFNLTDLLKNPDVKSVTAQELNNHLKRYVVNALELKISIDFYHVPNTNITVITTPLFASQYGEMLSYLNQYFSETDSQLETPRQFLMGLKGQGSTEDHIVTAYSSADRKTIKIFDSKTSDATQFFAKEPSNSIASLFTSLFRAIFPDARQSISIRDSSDDQKTLDVEYISLGTQSFFDPVSCGYHCASTIKICETLLKAKQPLTREAILERTANPVSEGYETVKRRTSYLVRLSPLDFLSKIWQDTMMPLVAEHERETTHFGHYFMGWPKEKAIANKVLYFATFGFLTNPLVNLVRRPIELILNSFSVGSFYIRNQLINWAPTHSSTQYLRSGLLLLTFGLEFLFKSIYYILGTVTSPIANFQAAQQLNNPILRNVFSALTIITTIAAYTTLAFFAAPAVFPLISSALPTLATLINVFVIPYIAPATVVFSILTIGGALGAALKMGLKKLFAEPIKIEGIEDWDTDISCSDSNIEDDIPDSNVGAHPELQPSESFNSKAKKSPISSISVSKTERRPPVISDLDSSTELGLNSGIKLN